MPLLKDTEAEKLREALKGLASRHGVVGADFNVSSTYAAAKTGGK